MDCGPMASARRVSKVSWCPSGGCECLNVASQSLQEVFVNHVTSFWLDQDCLCAAAFGHWCSGGEEGEDVQARGSHCLRCCWHHRWIPNCETWMHRQGSIFNGAWTSCSCILSYLSCGSSLNSFGWRVRTADANILINKARLAAQQYEFAYQEPISVEQLVRALCDNKQGYTQFGGLRPFGVSLLYGGWCVTLPAATHTIYTMARNMWSLGSLGSRWKELPAKGGIVHTEAGVIGFLF